MKRFNTTFEDEMTDDYMEFLESKFHFSQAYGHKIEQGDINPLLFPHQRIL